MPGAVVSIDLLCRGAVVSIDLLGRGAVVSTDMRSLGRSAGIGERGAWSAGRRGASSHLGVVRSEWCETPCIVRRAPSRPRHGTWLSSQLVTIGAGRWPASPRQRTEALPLARMTRCVMEACGTEKRSQASGGNCKARHTMYRITFAWQTTTSVVSPTWEGGNQRIISMQSRGSSACTLLLDPPGRAAAASTAVDTRARCAHCRADHWCSARQASS